MLTLLLACSSPDDTPAKDIPEIGPLDTGNPVGTDTDTTSDTSTDTASGTATVTLLSGDTCENPCSFSATITGGGDVTTLRYEADGWVLATVAVTAPTIAYTFNQLGERAIRVVAVDASGADLAEDEKAVTVEAPESAGGGLGVWLWYVEGTGLTHAELATRLADLGVRRIYVKVADGGSDCSTWPELCDATVPATYQAAGIEAWAWAYVYPGSTTSQADALRQAARTGYDGYVLDIEVEFDGQSGTLTDTMEAYASARAAVVADGTVDTGWELRATTWGNPADHAMRVDIIDRYVDAHMPQTYVEVWGSSYQDNPAEWVQAGTCEYRDLGATKPIHHIVSTEYGEITPAQIDSFIGASGPETSVWRVPGGGTPTSIWDDWAQVDWRVTTFEDAECP